MREIRDQFKNFALRDDFLEVAELKIAELTSSITVQITQKHAVSLKITHQTISTSR